MVVGPRRTVQDIRPQHRFRAAAELIAGINYYLVVMNTNIHLSTAKIAATLSLTCFLAACGPQGGYVIEGSSPRLADGKYVYVMDFATWEVLDSARTEESAVRISGDNMGSGAAMLYMGTSLNSDDLTQISNILFLEKGKISLAEFPPEDEFFSFKGTPMNDDYLSLCTFDGDDDARYGEAVRLIRKNRNALGCVLLTEMMSAFSKPQIMEMLEGYPEKMKGNPLLMQLQDMLDRIKADLDMPYMDFSGSDTGGRMVSLSEIVGNPGTEYVLLDFWASWCGPCRKELPNLKAAYEEYRDRGFDIFGVSFDSSRDKWLRTVSDEDMSWPNIIAEDGATRDSGIWQAYGLNGIPWNYLIDAESGMIVAKNLRGEDLPEKLAELLPDHGVQ